jgi:hypothetical protein
MYLVSVLKNTVIITDYTGSSDWLKMWGINWKVCGRKWLWPNWNYPGICLKGLPKYESHFGQGIACSGRNWNQGPSECKSEALPLSQLAQLFGVKKCEQQRDMNIPRRKLFGKQAEREPYTLGHIYGAAVQVKPSLRVGVAWRKTPNSHCVCVCVVLCDVCSVVVLCVLYGVVCCVLWCVVWSHFVYYEIFFKIRPSKGRTWSDV